MPTETTRNQVGLRLGEMLPGSTDNGERGVPVTGKPASQTTDLPPCGDDLCAPGCTVCREGGPLDQTTAQSHQETLQLLLNSDTSPCLYAHEVAALQAAIEALDRSAENAR